MNTSYMNRKTYVTPSMYVKELRMRNNCMRDAIMLTVSLECSNCEATKEEMDLDEGAPAGGTGSNNVWGGVW